MIRTRWLAVSTMALTAIPVAAPRARAQQLEPGVRIRVRTMSGGSDQLVGVFQASESDHLVMFLSESARMNVSWTDITRIQVSRGERSNAGKGAAIGFGVGGALGLAAGIAAANDDFLDAGAGEVIGATVFMGAIGAGIGALIGLAARSEKWETVAADQWQIQVAPDAKGGVTVGVSLRL